MSQFAAVTMLTISAILLYILVGNLITVDIINLNIIAVVFFQLGKQKRCNNWQKLATV